MTDIRPKVVAFIDQRELSVVREAIRAMRDCIGLRREIGLPVLPETRQAILELEDEIWSLRRKLLRSLSHDPEQLMLPGMPDDPWPGVKTRPSRTRNALNMIADAVDHGEWKVWHNLAGTTLLAQLQRPMN